MVTVNKLTTNDNTPALSGTVVDAGSGVAGVTVLVGGQKLVATVSGGVWTTAVPVALKDGKYNVSVTATDLAGNSIAVVAASDLLVDTTGPKVTATALVTKSTTPTLTGTVSDAGVGVGVVTVVIDGQTLTAKVTGSKWSVTVVTPLAAGVHDVDVTATDLLGNLTTLVAKKDLTVL